MSFVSYPFLTLQPCIPMISAWTNCDQVSSALIRWTIAKEFPVSIGDGETSGALPLSDELAVVIDEVAVAHQECIKPKEFNRRSKF